MKISNGLNMSDLCFEPGGDFNRPNYLFLDLKFDNSGICDDLHQVVELIILTIDNNW